MNKKLSALLSSAALMALPLVTLADIQPGSAPIAQQNLSVTNIVNIVLNFLWPLFIGFAVITFLIAGFLFLTAQGDPAKVATARTAVLWGIVGVVVGVLAFSIPFIVRNTLGF